MDHVAIMKKSWGLTQKILSGQKKIESRWYQNKYQPWDRIKAGETVYFKNSGEKVTIKAKVKKVTQFENLTGRKVKEILIRYGKDDGIDKSDLPRYFEMFKDKRYCLLIYLENVSRIKPFGIDKKGFGAMASWITTPHINSITLR